MLLINMEMYFQAFDFENLEYGTPATIICFACQIFLPFLKSLASKLYPQLV